MAVCCCSLAGTAACQHCRNNPMATDVWTNKTVMVDHIGAKPFGNGIDVCPVCGKPSTIGKPKTNADRIRAMTDEELAEWLERIRLCCATDLCGRSCPFSEVCYSNAEAPKETLDWLKEEVPTNG